MYCRNCGAQITDTAVFCTNCGKSIKAPQKKRHNYFLLVIIIVLSVFCLILFIRPERMKKNDFTEGSAFPETEELVQTEARKLTVKERLEEVIRLSEEDEEAAEEALQELMLEYQKESEIYFALAEIFEEKGDISGAKDTLMLGFEETEDENFMEEYIDISIKYAPDGNGKEYKVLKDFAEMIAEETDNTEKLEIAKKIYFYYQLVK